MPVITSEDSVCELLEDQERDFGGEYGVRSGISLYSFHQLRFPPFTSSLSNRRRALLFISSSSSSFGRPLFTSGCMRALLTYAQCDI